MIQRIQANLWDVDRINVGAQGRPLPPAPRPKNIQPKEREALKSALAIAEHFDSDLAIYRDLFEVAEHPPLVDIQGPAQTPVGLTPASRRAATLALGISAEAFCISGAGMGAGLYGSTTREFGVYYGGSVGVWTDIGFSGGIQYTFLFGGPGDLAGVSWGVGCNIDIPGTPVGAGAMLLFTMPSKPYTIPPNCRLLGYAVSLSAGTPGLPVSLTVQVSVAKTKPLLKLR
ncbi:hypothetical protein G3480_22740 [Thiorhodococcus mannitoliphagus]|uniref:Uncharacterized protein n=1 Tax=Thiorhodococcus mannitoliphagus TaxID=329406 RepID=A0A6P1DZZ7_9GAMM|nr:hypothetical protein [Thiorhodococcus mannitoliphagus]NEX23080.1 hypothetical protein [Thiorhodococcus mannitoliphagus]